MVASFPNMLSLVKTLAFLSFLIRSVDARRFTPTDNAEKCYFKDVMFDPEKIARGTQQYDDGFGGKKRIDIYSAVDDDRTVKPAVIMIHGGGGVSGNAERSCPRIVLKVLGITQEKARKRKDKVRECFALPEFARRLVQLGYVVFSIDYKLVNVVRHIASGIMTGEARAAGRAAKDARAAVQWVKRKAASFNVDPTKIAMMGDSFGGVITYWANYRTKDVEMDNSSDVDGSVAAAISLSGLITKYTNICYPKECPDDVQPPLLTICATKDTKVKYKDCELPYTRAVEVGLSTYFIKVVDMWHIPYTQLMDADPDQKVFYFDSYKQFLIDALNLSSACK